MKSTYNHGQYSKDVENVKKNEKQKNGQKWQFLKIGNWKNEAKWPKMGNNSNFFVAASSSSKNEKNEHC